MKILESFSKKVGKWKDEWITFDSQHKKKISDYESTWDLFRITTSSIAGFTESIDVILEKLDNINGSIPDPDKNQRLEVKIKEARKEIDSLDGEIDKLLKEKTNLEQKIANTKEKPSKTFRSCISPESPMDNLIQRQSSTITLIHDKQESLKRKLVRFEVKKGNLYQASRKDEVERSEQLKQYATNFLEAFNLKVTEFEQTSKIYDADADLTEWEKKNPPLNSKQLQRSQSVKNKDIPQQDE